VEYADRRAQRFSTDRQTGQDSNPTCPER
jgi:hypothetical protein